MKNYMKHYSCHDVEAIVFGVALGHSFDVIANSMGRTRRGIEKVYKRAMNLIQWQEYQSEIKVRYAK